MNELKKIAFPLLMVLFFGISALAQNVNVTATGGTTTATYPTVKAAFDAVNAGMHSGVITVNIAVSTTEIDSAVLNGNGAGGASYTSLIVRPAADGVAVSGATAAGRGLIELNGADNVTIDGDNPNSAGVNRNLTLQNTAVSTTDYTSVIRVALNITDVNSADNDVFRNLNIFGSATGRNIGTANTSAGAEFTTYGIVAAAGASSPNTAPTALVSVNTNIAAGATAANLIISNNRVITASRAVSVLGSAVSVFSGLSVQSNLIGNPTAGAADQVYGLGIQAQGSTNGVISGNTVYVEGFIGSATTTHGISIAPLSAAGTFTIEKNKVNRVRNNNGATWSAYGINLGGGSNHIVRNNFVGGVINDQTAGTGSFSTTFGAFGIRVGLGTDHKIYHNSVHLTGVILGNLNTNLVAAFAVVGTAQTGVDVRNNIFSNQLTGGNPGATTGTRVVAIYVPAGATSAMNLTLNNNDYFVGTEPINRLALRGVFSGGEYTSDNFDPTTTTPATNFRSYSSTLSADGNNDNATKKVDPLFVSNTDLHIQATSPMRAMGANVGVADDIDGNVRPAVPAIGADEIGGIRRNTIMDFNGDGKTDWAVTRAPSPGTPYTWYIRYNGQDNLIGFEFGRRGSDIPIPVDYDGDGKDDVAVWRNNGFYYIINSSDNSFRAVFVGGGVGSSPVAADYDGDGKDDPAVFVVPTAAQGAGQGNWCYVASQNNPSQQVTCIPWGYRYGSQADQVDDAYPGDFDGDGKADFRVQRRVDISNTGSTPAIFYTRTATGAVSYDYFGLNGDRILPGDYDGDGKTDLCVARGFNLGTTPPTPIRFFIRYSSGLPDAYISFGEGINFNFAQGDYDGDGKDDIALLVSGSDPNQPQQRHFWVRPSANPNQTIVYPWGTTGDLPVAGYNNR